MKKMFKTAASLAVGCALLSTSAFAALINPSVVESEETAGIYTASVTKEGATSWESTILVLKANSVETVDGETKIKSTVNDEDIYYINQTSATSDTATYSIAETTEKLYVFAGGSGEDAALYLGSIDANVPATGVVISGDGVTTNESNVKVAALTVEDKLQLNADVAPETATDKTVTWTSSSDEIATVVDGLVTAKAAGTVTITATANNGTEQAKDAVEITISEKVVEPEEPAGDFFDATGADGETQKAKVTSAKKATVGESLWIFKGYSEKYVIDLGAEYADTATTIEKEETITYKNYTLSVVTDDDNAAEITSALVFYARENNKWIVLIPDGVTSYKFKLTAGQNTNTVLGDFGDVTGDGKILAGDYNLVKRSVNGYTTGNATTSIDRALRADVSADGKLMAGDYNLIKRCVNGLSYSFPAAK